LQAVFEHSEDMYKAVSMTAMLKSGDVSSPLFERMKKEDFNFSPETRETIDGINQWLIKQRHALKVIPAEYHTPISQYIGDVIEQAPQMVMVWGLAIVNPALGSAALGTYMFGDGYGEQRDNGISKERALIANGFNVAVQLPMESIPIFKFLNLYKMKGGKKAIGKAWLELIIAEPLTEAGQEFPETLTRIWAEGEKTGDSAKTTASKMWEAMPETMKEGVYAGLVVLPFALGGGAVRLPSLMKQGKSLDNHQKLFEQINNKVQSIEITKKNPGLVEKYLNDLAKQNNLPDNFFVSKTELQSVFGDNLKKIANELGISDQLNNATDDNPMFQISVGKFSTILGGSEQGQKLTPFLRTKIDGETLEQESLGYELLKMHVAKENFKTGLKDTLPELINYYTTTNEGKVLLEIGGKARTLADLNLSDEENKRLLLEHGYKETDPPESIKIFGENSLFVPENELRRAIVKIKDGGDILTGVEEYAELYAKNMYGEFLNGKFTALTGDLKAELDRLRIAKKTTMSDVELFSDLAKGYALTENPESFWGKNPVSAKLKALLEGFREYIQYLIRSVSMYSELNEKGLITDRLKSILNESVKADFSKADNLLKTVDSVRTQVKSTPEAVKADETITKIEQEKTAEQDTVTEKKEPVIVGKRKDGFSRFREKVFALSPVLSAIKSYGGISHQTNEFKGGEYDGLNEGNFSKLDRSFFMTKRTKSKEQGKNTPDIIADMLYREGLLSEPDVDMLWSLIRSELDNVKTNKEMEAEQLKHWKMESEKGEILSTLGVTENKTDNVNTDDNLVIAHELENFLNNPVGTFNLKSISQNILSRLGKSQKPLILKQNIVEKNKNNHSDLTIKDDVDILLSSIYEPTEIIQSLPNKKPNYFSFVKFINQGKQVQIELSEEKDNYEIIGWHYSDDKSLDRQKRRAEREGGEILIIPDTGIVGTPFQRFDDSNNIITQNENKPNDVVEKNETEQGEIDTSDDWLFGDSLAEDEYIEEDKEIVDDTPVSEIVLNPEESTVKDYTQTVLIPKVEAIAEQIEATGTLTDENIQDIKDVQAEIEDNNIREIAGKEFLHEISKANIESNTTFSMQSENKLWNDNFSKHVDKALESKHNSSITVSRAAPNILRLFGVPNHKIVISSDVIKQAVGIDYKKTSDNIHDVNLADVKNLPALLDNPVIVIKPENINSSFEVFVEALDRTGNPLLIPLRITAVKGNNIITPHVIPSIYGKNGAVEYLNRKYSENLIGYINQEKFIKIFNTPSSSSLSGLSDITPQASTSEKPNSTLASTVGHQLPLGSQSIVENLSTKNFNKLQKDVHNRTLLKGIIHEKTVKNKIVEKKLPVYSNTTFQMSQDKLIAFHNLSKENLEHVNELGGLAMPSLGIAKVNHPVTSFGEIALIPDKDMIDPSKNKQALTKNADFYTPRHPRATIRVEDKEYYKAVDELKKLGSELNINARLFSINDIEERGLEAFKTSLLVKALFLKNKGEKVTPVFDNHNKRIKELEELIAIEDKELVELFGSKKTAKELKDSFREEIARLKPRFDEYETAKRLTEQIKPFESEFNTFVKDKYGKVIAEKRLFKGITNTGRKYKPYTLENVVAEMKSNMKQGESFNYGVGTIRSKVAKKFKNLKEIQAKRDNIVSTSEMEKIKENIQEEYNTLESSLIGKLQYKSSFGFPFADHLIEIAETGQVKKVLDEYYNNVTDEDVQNVADFLNMLKDMPTEYFESKIQRAVMLDEFKTALVPKGIEYAQSVEILQSHGIEVKRYEKGNQESLEKAYSSLSNSTFQFVSTADNLSEIANIKELYQNTDKWRKAPNGKDSNLNEFQWLQVRTQAFKKWFGDWEKKFRIEKLKDSKPIEITGNEIEYNEDFKTYKKNAYEYGKKIRGEYTNKDTGEKISFVRDSLNEVLQHDKKNKFHIQSIPAIPLFIENSIYITSMPNEDTKVKTDKFDYYAVGLKIGKEDYTVKIVIADIQGQKYYDHKLTQIEKGKLIDSSRAISNAPINQNLPSTIEDSRLLQILQEDYSKVVDENGEPLVVYHGGTVGNVFSSKFSGTGGGRESAFFFTPDKRQAKDYAGSNKIKEVYLDLKNPIMTDIQLDIEDIKNGEDGYWIIEDDLINESEIAVFSPTQIKSATGNIGTFDGSNPNITYQFIGKKGASALDQSEEATTRLDNLSIAREMETAGKEFGKVIKELPRGDEKIISLKSAYSTDMVKVFNEAKELWNNMPEKIIAFDGREILIKNPDNRGALQDKISNRLIHLLTFDKLGEQEKRAKIDSSKAHFFPNILTTLQKGQLVLKDERSNYFLYTKKYSDNSIHFVVVDFKNNGVITQFYDRYVKSSLRSEMKIIEVSKPHTSQSKSEGTLDAVRTGSTPKSLTNNVKGNNKKSNTGYQFFSAENFIAKEIKQFEELLEVYNTFENYNSLDYSERAKKLMDTIVKDIKNTLDDFSDVKMTVSEQVEYIRKTKENLINSIKTNNALRMSTETEFMKPKDFEKIYERIKAEFDKLKDIAQPKDLEEIKANIQKLQSSLLSLVNTLPKAERYKFNSNIAEITSKYGDEKATKKYIDSSLKAMDRVFNTYRKKEIIKEIIKDIQRFRERKDFKGRPISKIYPEVQSAVKIISNSLFKRKDVQSRILALTSKDSTLLTENEQIELYLLVTFGNINSKSIDDVRMARMQLIDIIADGMSKRLNQIRLFEANVRKERNIIIETVGGEKYGEKARTLSQEQKRHWNRVFSSPSAFQFANLSFEWIMNNISRKNKNEESGQGYLVQKWAKDVMRASTNKQTMTNKQMEELLKVQQEIFKTKSSITLHKKLRDFQTIKHDTGIYIKAKNPNTGNFDGAFEPLNISQDTAVYLYLASKQSGVFERMFATGWDDTAFDSLKAFMTPEAFAYADWLSNQYKNSYEPTNNVYKKMFFTNLPVVENYAPMSYLVVGKTQENVNADIENLTFGGGNHQATAMFGSLISRVEHSREINYNASATALYMRHVNNTAHFITHAELVKEMRAVWKNENVRNALKQNLGNSKEGMLQYMIDNIIRGGMEDGKVNKAISKLMSFSTKWFLSFKAVTFLKQWSSAPAYMMNVPIVDFFKYSAEFWANPVKNINELKEVEYIKNRWIRGNSFEMSVTLREAEGKPKNYIGQAFNSGMLPVRLGDILPVMTGYYIVQKSKYKQFINKGMSHDDALIESHLEAGMSSDRSQQASGIKDISYIRQQGSWVNMLQMFSMSQNQYMNILTESWADVKAGKKGALQKASKNTAVIILLGLMFQGAGDVFSYLLSGGDDTPDWEDYLLAGLISPLGGYLFIGNVLMFSMRKAFDLPAYKLNFSPALDVVETIATSMQSLTEADFERALKNLTRNTGICTNVKPFVVEKKK